MKDRRAGDARKGQGLVNIARAEFCRLQRTARAVRYGESFAGDTDLPLPRPK